jgi:act minimal PKS acyl carrier protein
MARINLDELTQALTECAGADEEVPLRSEALDTPFTDLGYDSLALLETAALIQQRYGVALTDEEVTDIETPREFIDRVNAAAVQPA